jgi:hypothetical protein
MGVHAEVNVPCINAVAFCVRDRDEERKNSEHQNYQSDYGERSHAQILRLACVADFGSEFISLPSDANQSTCGAQSHNFSSCTSA